MRPAEELLIDLGISEPSDIEIAAIAFCVGAELEYRPLVGCEAQIIGFRDRAIIYVDDSMRLTRQKFSGGHDQQRAFRALCLEFCDRHAAESPSGSARRPRSGDMEGAFV